MKNMKKTIIVGMTAAILATAVLPALAENTANTPAMQNLQQQARGGRKGMNRGGQPGRTIPDGQQNGNNNNPFRGGRGTNDNRMNPWKNGQMPDDGTDAESGATKKNYPLMRGGRGGHRGGYGRIGMQDLVEQGIIDQETADKIGAYFQDKKTENKLNDLVEGGVIDQETADKISAYLDSLKPQAPTDEEAPVEGELPPKKPDDSDPALAALVEQGVITQEQADAIEAARAAQPAPTMETDPAAEAEI